ncbi:transmembrane protein 2-like [Plakobranchus ocellatus]|uniref:Transmembrane protein 2-like n=1 Tax=Plakobranchus ocellatus TaxID=259542 RepID=A0AAV4DMA2_9GAST|nr:transmembrane protein 2-like [Plakobranchus ocellatus]
MRQTLSFLWGVAFLAISSRVFCAAQSCPWDDKELKSWRDPNSWPLAHVPKKDEHVFIPAGTKIVLDTPIPRFKTIEINGSLVWGNVDGIRMETGYVLVNGEFHIGSEECNFEKEADIFLYGKTNSPDEIKGFGRKFIGGNPGSKIEIHGKQKQSWTKLIATVYPTTPGPCGFVYDSLDVYVKRKFGIWINVWNADGTNLRLESFDLTRSNKDLTLATLATAIKNIPDGKILGVAIFKSLTFGPLTEGYEEVFKALEGLGASQIRHVGEYEPYVFIAEAGKTVCTEEQHTKRRPGYTGRVDASVKFDHGDLVFQAISVAEQNGKRDQARFRVLHREAAYPKLSFLHDVSTWRPGDEIVVASTDFEWRQAEVKTIIPCRECMPNQVRVEDERAEVGLLSRNIRVEGEIQPDCYSYTEEEEALCKRFKRDTFGGHIKFLHNSWARVEGVQLTGMGQQGVLATYPLHYHLADSVQGQYVRNNVIRNSNSRCVTIHGTDYLEVSDNVCYMHLGHGIFLEDSAEQNNTIRRNLIIGTQYGTLLLTDRDANWCKDRDFCDLLSSIWITHPRNYFTENVAAGSDGFGIVLAFADRPLGPSYERMKNRGLYEEMSTRYMKVAEFSKNTMHSNKRGGLWFDNRLSYGQIDMHKYVPENGKLGLNQYTPRDPPTPNGTIIESILSELTLYKNEDRNTWMRCGNIVITNSSFADSCVSYVAAHSGEDPTSCDVRNSIFIGETDNKGTPWTYTFNHPSLRHMKKSKRPSHYFDRSIPKRRPDFLISAVQFYQGPVYLDNCYFDQYKTEYYNDSVLETYGFRPMKPAAALTFHPNNHYPMIPTSGVSNLRFGFCDGEDNSFRVMDGNASTTWWTEFDGTLNVNFRDYDGTLTGTARTQIVNDRPFFTTNRCTSKSKWGLSVCPYKYFQLVVRGGSGVLQNRYKGKTPVLIRRDEHPEDVYAQKGITAHKFLLMVSKSYTIFFNDTLGDSPRDIQLRPRFGLEKGEVVRIALCLPKSTTKFSVYSRIIRLNPKRYLSPRQVFSLEEVDNDNEMRSWFWDQANGYLYMKIYSPLELENPDQECPGNECIEWDIIREDGGNEPAVCDGVVPPFVMRDRAKKVKFRRCRTKGSPEGLGAPIESGYVAPSTSSGTCGSPFKLFGQ